MGMLRLLLRWSLVGAVVGVLVGGIHQEVGAQPPPILVTGAGAGGGPHVRVFNAETGAVLFEFFAFDPAFTGGVRVATADVNGDGTPDVIVAAGEGGGPHVRVLDGAALLLGNIVDLQSFMAYDPAFTGGVYVAANNAAGGPAAARPGPGARPGDPGPTGVPRSGRAAGPPGIQGSPGATGPQGNQGIPGPPVRRARGGPTGAEGPRHPRAGQRRRDHHRWQRLLRSGRYPAATSAFLGPLYMFDIVFLQAGEAGWDAGEGGWDAVELQGGHQFAPGTGASWTFTVRKNQARTRASSA